jgi:membrane dipeptidase
MVREPHPSRSGPSLRPPVGARAFLLLALLLPPVMLSAQTPAPGPDPHLETALRVLATTPLIDGHNDLPWQIRLNEAARMDVRAYGLESRPQGHTDLPRLREGRLGGQFWSVYVPVEAMETGAARFQLEQIDIALRLLDEYPEHFGLALTAQDVMRIFHEGRIASILGMEGGHAIENSLGALRTFFDLGVRYMTLTHNRNLDWADAASDPPLHGGLSPFGEEVIREMNRLGMLVDLSHVSDGTMSHVLDVTEAPVIFSHSSVRALTDHVRNVPDSILDRMPANGGVVMITFVPAFVSEEVRLHGVARNARAAELRALHGGDGATVARELEEWDAGNPEPRATLAQVADHVDYVRDRIGVAYVGIGADYDGITSVPVGLEDVSTYPALLAELSRRGWSEGELRMLAGENILRVMREAEGVARRLQREQGPSHATVDGAPASGGEDDEG